MSKEEAIYRAILQSLNHRQVILFEQAALLVHAVMVSNGHVPKGIIGDSDKPGFVQLIPSAHFMEPTTGVVTFNYMDNVEVKCIVFGQAQRLAVHASDTKQVYSLNLELPCEQDLSEEQIQKIIHLVKGNILSGLNGGHPAVREEQRRTIQTHQPPVHPSGSEVLPPRAPPFGTPIGPGELVGPEHPIFTGEGQTGEGRQRGVRDPRFDPIGPGYIGEPDADHFPPPPFGQPPSGARRPAGRTPLRGPFLGPGGGDMFM
jgi:hypothetical protein